MKQSNHPESAKPADDDGKFGMRLQAARLVRGIRRAKDVDALLDLTEGSWSRYEKGAAAPKLALLKQFADVLDVSLDALFARHDDFSRSATWAPNAHDSNAARADRVGSQAAPYGHLNEITPAGFDPKP